MGHPGYGPDMTTTPANWYPDPHDANQVRYWDGQQWTSHVAPRVDPAAPQHQPAQQQPAQVAPAAPTPPAPAQAPAQKKVSIFGARGAARDLAEENEHLRAALAQVDGLTLAGVLQQTAQARRQLGELEAAARQTQARAAAELAAVTAETEALRQQVIDLRNAIDVQEFGLYDYEHPAESSATLAGELERVRAAAKEMVKSGRAINATSNFMFNNSAAKGKAMVAGLSKTMLAAYNAEVENASKAVKAGGLTTAQARLDKVVEQIERNGKMIDLSIAMPYHQLRRRELELAALHAQALAAEREAEKEHRAELREAKRAEDELRRAREQLDKEREHYVNALAAMRARGDEAGAAELAAKLAEIDQSIADVDFRAANIRAGYVYVISNVGSFGETVVKIGMTRRLDPMDRVRELGDASVPFTFDVHALFFSEDAFGIEAMLHRTFAAQRVNRINTRREFFYATPAQVLEVLQAHKVSIVEYRTEADAQEFRISRELAAAVTD
ncbi:DUF4041 domain-containing protein [Cellulomonas sp.]|uniref:DUF4041 domain-containing protein n=1 Tax=Cellulomonas sp. TaxID=40001 RepID=UPI003BAB483A